MKRRAWNIFCALSLLIFATAATLFVRSWLVRENFRRNAVYEGLNQIREVNFQPGFTNIYTVDSSDDFAETLKRDPNPRVRASMQRAHEFFESIRKKQIREWKEEEDTRERTMADIQTRVTQTFGWSRGTVAFGNSYSQSHLFWQPAPWEIGWQRLTEKWPAPWIAVPASPSNLVHFSWGGFELAYSVDEDPRWIARDLWVRLPLWLFLIFAVPPLLWWRKQRRNAHSRGFPVQEAEKNAQSSQRHKDHEE